jgi:hypothetical protein
VGCSGRGGSEEACLRVARWGTLCTQMFDVIFVDGLHLSEQVLTDVKNALRLVQSSLSS